MNSEPVASVTIIMDDLGESREMVARCGRDIKEGLRKAWLHWKTRNFLKRLG